MTSVRPGKHAEDNFASSPLVIWIQSYLGTRKTSNDELSNGVLLNNILNLIDPNAFCNLHIRTNGINDVSSRAQNLVEILNGIKRYYQEKLQQVVVMKMPDILLLAKESHSELSYSAMNDILLLILGCAIQCEKKEQFIEHIKQLDVDVQRGLVASIQEITENPDNVIPYRINELAEISRDELLQLCENLYRHLQGAMEQRDDYIETIIDFVLLQDSEEYREKLNEESPKFRPRNSITQASFHSSNMLQAKNERISTLQSELDEQNGLIADMKEELEKVKMQLESMRLENKHLVNEAAWAKTYRDELDVLKAQLENTNKLRSENARLKGIAEDVEFYKKKYEEIQDQTDLLYEQKLLLEEQAKDSSSKIQRLNLLENENKKLCTQVNLLVEEQGEDQRRIRELVDEIAKLSVEKQESISACSVMNAELDGLRMAKEDDGLNVPLMVEYNQSADLLRLEKDNKHLQSIVDSMGVPDSRIKTLEDYNRNLAENIIYYKNLIGKLIKCLILAGDTNQELCDVTKREYNKMLQMFSNIKHTSQLDSITRELECLVNQLAKKGVVIDASTIKEALVVKSDQKTDESSENSKEGAERSKLRDNLEEKEKIIAELEKSMEGLNELSQQNAALKDDITHKEEKLRCLGQSIQKLDELTRINGQLKSDVSDKEREITKLRKSMEEANELLLANTRLKNELVIKDESIHQLKENLKMLDELTRINGQLKGDVSDKEREIANLRKSMEEENELILANTRLKNKLVIKDESILQLKEDLEKLGELTRINGQLKGDVSDKEREIENLRKSMEESNELTLANTQLKDGLVIKDESILQLKEKLEKLDELSHINGQLKCNVSDKEREITSLRNSMEEANELMLANTQLKNELVIKDESIHQLKENLDRSNELITRINSQLKNDVSEKEQKATKLKQGEQKLKEVKMRNTELENDITNKDKTIAYLKQRLDDLNDVLDVNNQLQEDLTCKEKKLSNFKESLDKLKELSDVNEQLKDIIKTKDQKLALLKENVTKVTELTHLNNQLKDALTIKDQKIFQLEKRVSSLEESAGGSEEMKKYIESKQQEISHKEKEVKDRDNKIKDKDNKIKDKEKEIKDKEKEVASLQNKIKEVNTQLQKSEEKCEELKKNMENELKKISEKIPELQRTSSESGQLKSIVKDKDNQILLLHDSLNEFQCKASQLETRIEELTSANSRCTSASQQKDERLISLKNQLEEYLSSNRTLTNDLKMKEEKLKSVTRSLEETMERNNDLEEDINMLEKDLEQLKQTGSLKNITNITEKIKLTKRARTELHIQRCPVKMKQKTSNIEVKPSSELNEYRELVEKLHQENQCMDKQTASMTEDLKKLSNENAALQMENETIMSTLNLLKLDYEAIQKEMDEAREHFQELDISATKIAHRCEVLVQLNATLEEENRAMMEQVNKLFAQNQDLLVSTLYNREQYIEDERAFSDHIYELEREKEKLADQIIAAEKALLLDGRRKGALWRGTHKILKRAGLAKRKDSNPRHADCSLDIQDFEKDGGGIVPLTRENRMSLESIHSVRSANRISNNSSPISSLYRNIKNAKNGDDSLTNSSNSIRSQKNGDDSTSGTPNSFVRPVQRNGDDSPIVASSHRSAQKNGDDNSTSTSIKPSSHSTPIQKVFVTQLTTPTVMKASPDGVNIDYQTGNSPNFIRKLPSTQPGDKTPLELPGKTGNIKGLRKQSFSTSSSRSSPLLNDIQSSFNEENETHILDKENKLLDRRNYTNFKEIMTDTMSLDSSDDIPIYSKSPGLSKRSDELRSGSMSPTVGTHSFGSREQRSSFRRYEIEHMEPRPLPQNDGFGSEEDLLSKPSRIGVNRNKTPENSHSTEEQRSSLRKVMIGNTSSDSVVNPPGQKKDLNSNTKKLDQSWYEYGNV